MIQTPIDVEPWTLWCAGNLPTHPNMAAHPLCCTIGLWHSLSPLVAKLPVFATGTTWGGLGGQTHQHHLTIINRPYQPYRLSDESAHPRT